MNHNENIRKLEETLNEVIRFTNELDEKLARNEIDGIHYHVLLNEKLSGRTKEEIISHIEQKIKEEKNKAREGKKKTITISAAAIILIIIAIIGIIYPNPGALTGYTTATKQIEQKIDYNRVFEHYTETQLDLTNLTSLKISGTLEGTGAKIKLRINGTEYLIAQITNPTEQPSQITGMVIEEETTQYTITTDKTTYTLGETATITITPTTNNQSLYVSYGEETHKLETNTYKPETTGNYQIIALIVLPEDIIRINTNFTVTSKNNSIFAVPEKSNFSETETTTTEETPKETNETNQTTPTNETTPTENTTVNETNQTNETTPTEPTTNAFVFENLCTETCTLTENSNPVLIVELDDNTTLTINTLTTTQTKENLAPEQNKNIPDITLAKGESRTINLNNYFKDPEEETIQYDINKIPEITTTINQNELTITSQNLGKYTAYIYATDGNKMIVSNTFTITITETTEETTTETNQTTNETTGLPISNETEIVLTPIIDCGNPNPNNRPVECMIGQEDKYFKDKSIFIENLDKTQVARITAFGNMVIRGKLYENSIYAPSSRDFRVNYFIDDGETEVVSAWIDTATGDLHLRGTAHEEQFSIIPPSTGAFIIQNRKGTNLGFIDKITGDLYLRGNLIQEQPEENVITQ
ncbi:hypothetical protein JW756_04730 [Candidatus Woesearchaeota archaeon]|nr:hypothetical protein [Candidatus Woesearchaeota archaeon]